MMSHEPSPPIRVLVVEDEPTVAQMLTDVLEADGHEVETAANGFIALDRIVVRAYDIIISDLRMPELDGAGLYREIERAQPALLSRLIFITGSTEHPEYQRFLAETLAPVLPKPFNVIDLQELIRQVLSGHRHVPERA
jgi:two-component system NtrC family sensor kinase